MWEFLRSDFCLLCVSVLAVCGAGNGVPPPTVNGTRGQSIILSSAHQVGENVEVLWRRTETKRRITRYLKQDIDYFGPEEYKQRITFHPGNFSLEIRDLRRNDTGVYEMVTAGSSGEETSHKIQLAVYEPVSGTRIMVHNITRNCNFTLICSATLGNPTSFRWWKEGEALGDNSTHHLQEREETVEVHYTAEVEDLVYWCEARNLVSEDTAQIRLWDICRQNKPDHGTLKIGLICGGVVYALVTGLILLRVKCRSVRLARVAQKRNGAGRDNSADLESPHTIYAQVQLADRCPDGRPTPEGNDMVTVDRVVESMYMTAGAKGMVSNSIC